MFWKFLLIKKNVFLLLMVVAINMQGKVSTSKEHILLDKKICYFTIKLFSEDIRKEIFICDNIKDDSIFYIKPSTVFVDTNQNLHLTVKKTSADLNSFIYVKKGTILSNKENIKEGNIVYTANATSDQLVANTKPRLANFDKIYQKKENSKKAVSTNEFRTPFPNPFKQTSCLQPYFISISFTDNDNSKNKSCLDDYLTLSYSKFTASLVNFVYKPPVFLDTKSVLKLLLYNSFFARPPPII